jgi:hypothetical protein
MKHPKINWLHPVNELEIVTSQLYFTMVIGDIFSFKWCLLLFIFILFAWTKGPYEVLSSLKCPSPMLLSVSVNFWHSNLFRTKLDRNVTWVVLKIYIFNGWSFTKYVFVLIGKPPPQGIVLAKNYRYMVYVLPKNLQNYKFD